MTTQLPGTLVISENYEEAFDATRDARAALRPDELSNVYADVMSAAGRAYVAAEAAAKYDSVLATLPVPTDLRQQVMRFAEAASGSHVRFANADRKPPVLIPLIDELRAERDLLLSDVKALITRGLVSAERLREIQGTMGHRAIAQDVRILSGGLIQSWATVEGKTGASLAELEQWRDRAEEADKAVTRRELQEKDRAEAADDRQRAFTLLVRAYDAFRRAMTFILWDSAELAAAVPPLQNGRPRRNEAADEEVVEPGVATGAAPVASPAPAPVNGAPAPAAPIDNRPGMPGSSPFLQS